MVQIREDSRNETLDGDYSSAAELFPSNAEALGSILQHCKLYQALWLAPAIPASQEAEAGGLPGLQGEFKASLGNLQRSCLKIIWAWLCTFVIPAPWTERQENHEMKTYLNYMAAYNHPRLPSKILSWRHELISRA